MKQTLLIGEELAYLTNIVRAKDKESSERENDKFKLESQSQQNGRYDELNLFIESIAEKLQFDAELYNEIKESAWRGQYSHVTNISLDKCFCKSEQKYIVKKLNERFRKDDIQFSFECNGYCADKKVKLRISWKQPWFKKLLMNNSLFS